MHVRLYVDGGVLGKNPSTDGVYWSVGREHDDGHVELLTARAEDRSRFTNNDAEYLALCDALQHAVRIPGMTQLTIHSDSQLIVNQFNGRWKIGEERLKLLCEAAQASATYLTNGGVALEVLWVRRAENVKRLGH